jgi:two-component system, cell cycle sensor histidine kinase and response regulator CckA
VRSVPLLGSLRGLWDCWRRSSGNDIWGIGVTLQPQADLNGPTRRRTILLVEDEPFVREATCSILESAGFQVLPVEDALGALELYKERQREIDLVMTDMVLPGRTGQQLGQDLREQSPEVLILVTSGYLNPEYETETPEERTYFLAKPYSKRTLVEKIEKVLGSGPISRSASQAG